MKDFKEYIKGEVISEGLTMKTMQKKLERLGDVLYKFDDVMSDFSDIEDDIVGINKLTTKVWDDIENLSKSADILKTYIRKNNKK